MQAFEVCERNGKAVAVDDIAESVQRGEIGALARAITLVEQRAPGHVRLLKTLFPSTGHAQIIGITGPPGSGKSTLAGQLIRGYRQQHKRVAVIAVDPTSPYSGGATLGDRIRMQQFASDSGVFIRSMASRGQIGGLAPTTADVATVLDASGWDCILVETVGVGQDQVDVVSVADAVMVLMVPGMGDDVQLAKAGIVEAADIFVINKSDREGVEPTERALHECISLSRRESWAPRIVRTVATTGTGISELIGAVDSYFQFLRQNGLLLRKVIEKWQSRLVQMVREHLTERLLNPENGTLFRSYAAAIVERRTDPYTVVEHLLGTAIEQSHSAPSLDRRPM
jgi:LAO/AO transport system kinase